MMMMIIIIIIIIIIMRMIHSASNLDGFCITTWIRIRGQVNGNEMGFTCSKDDMRKT
jgi:hypothetical protein